MTDSFEAARVPFVERQARLAVVLQQAGLQALVLNPGPSLMYLTGLNFHLMERPTVAVFVPGAPVQMVLPQLELLKLEGVSYPLQAHPYGENPESWPQAFQSAGRAAGLAGGSIGVEPGRMRLLEFRFLEAALPGACFPSAEAGLSALRMRKEPGELRAMRRAVEIAQNALLATLPFVRIGMSERELAAELTLQLLRAGSDSEAPFAPIVSGGPNSANPHASPAERRLTAGDLLVIDWGASYQGYASDLTRTFAIGEVEHEMHTIAGIVEQANAAARAAAGPGVPAEQVDQAARQVIEQAGYGAYFTHRTGHGLGLEGHEAPYIRLGNTELLEPGMTFTIEPGIYLPNRNGVRIEDDMVITSQGAESLSSLPRRLQTIL